MHSLTRRSLILALAAASSFAQAQGGYPSRTIEWVVPYPAGGGTDVVARTLGQAVSEILGQPVIINNKPGAATNIGADYTARAKPDGYTVMSADTATLAANPALYSHLPYNAEKDFAPVGLTVRFPMILVVNNSVPAKNLPEFLAWARKTGNTTYATPGAGSPHHLATELFKDQAKLSLTHVPYRGAAPAVQDVVAGQVPFMFVDTASGKEFIASGKLRPIGVASPRRVVNFENIPTLSEQGMKGFEAYAWQGVVMPAATPPEVVKKFSEALQKAMASTQVRARLQVLGLEPIPGSPAEMAKYAAAERTKWGQVIRANNIRVD
ncbi:MULTISPECIES: tripartite tricarboxylate transporter substrate binding protein [Ramlibacter]|uniref:Tripartite tricarboxylate transporter substrate binding protein n=1 Tax=Ramlibacter aquaticus TaxID=2780094 RepID=A0ABR9SC18_9BURK|nr:MULTISPECIES: tripartite tricarboxylate transporter substrate binding protein [Ramlibacter]MBE7939891.1 tripartite tricarboxylate transporter substrate binding protein [Ramlibacter aquaticus]